MMTPTPDQVAPHIARFLDMLDAAFRGYGVSDGLPERFRNAVAATPRHMFVHRFRLRGGPLRDPIGEVLCGTTTLILLGSWRTSTATP
jgi:hypothetical protein